jgi:hypothetical protein
MPVVDLSQIANRSGAISAETRYLAYQIDRRNSYWWRLTVTLPIRYVFAFEPLWTQPRKTTFMRTFETNGGRAWSRRHLLRQNGILTTTHCQVHVEVMERNVVPNQQWHVLVLPPESVHARAHVNYDHSGTLPREVEGGPQYTHIAFAQLQERDLGCNWDHIRAGEAHLTRELQRGGDHEIGHMLGMQHPLCNTDRTPDGGRSCYGDPGTTTAGSIMGRGSWVSRRDYHWAKRIVELDTGYTWELIQDNWRGPSANMCTAPTTR